MNRKIGAISSTINLLAVLGFAVSMLLRFNFGSYFFCRSDDLPEEEIRKMAADASANPWRVFHKLSAVADFGHFSGGQPSMDRCSGVAVLEFWCAYFCPVAILSFLHFWHKEESENV